jgi:AraC-like DNA-binding protein
MLRSYLRVFLILARRAQMAQSGVPHPQEAGLALAKHFMQLVDTHFLTTSSVADYAQMLTVTTNHLVATLTRIMGKPAGRLIRERLILEAKRLLRHSDLSISEVAYHLKFEDPSYFSRFFKKHADVTPAQFRGV